MTTSQPSPPVHTEARGPLAAALINLAQTPDDLPGIDAQLAAIARLTADRVAGVDYASITALRGGDHITVAASSELADSVDQAQYADADGPCLRSLSLDTPVTVPDIAGTMTWPGFHEAAAAIGLHASTSIPLSAGSGTPVAVLNLYGHDAVAMAPLIAGVWAVYDPAQPVPGGDGALAALDAGAAELLAGFAEALSVRATIQLALRLIMERTRSTARDAYVTLRLNAADAGASLLTAANTVIQGDL